MGRLIEKWFGFSQIREELEARIGELENENAELFTTKEKLTKENTELAYKNNKLFKENEKISGLENANDQLWQAKDKLTKENTELTHKNAALTEKTAELKTENDKLNHLKVAFNEKSGVNFKEEVSKEDRTKFEQALRVLHAIVNNETSSRYLSDENQKFIEDLVQDKKITNEKIEKTLEIVSDSDVDVDFEKFKELMLKVDNEAVGLKSYSQSQLLDLDGGHWDLEVPSAPKESVTFRFDNLPKDKDNKEMNFYARSSLKDLNKGVVAIDFGTKSTTAAYMDNNGVYRLLSIGGDMDTESLEKHENPTIVEFRNKEKFLKDYNALNHRPFTEKNDIEVAHEAQKNAAGVKGNDLYRSFLN